MTGVKWHHIVLQNVYEVIWDINLDKINVMQLLKVVSTIQQNQTQHQVPYQK